MLGCDSIAQTTLSRQSMGINRLNSAWERAIACFAPLMRRPFASKHVSVVESRMIEQSLLVSYALAKISQGGVPPFFKAIGSFFEPVATTSDFSRRN